ncbi:tRNA (Guanine-N(7)-)-methyltransferase subunit trm82 [Rhynchospora pubera]|uniref:tRNA (Guanine-N(7)-)-methyltransferase subunit trm82 n=1 Tax=Rhynchospora pubera TaxID=906938 RepID=A0AAV8EMH0_9POAL|nr:tRNA (Guanine-N(7)-)-methyltransferase subunit trm82 [Rhynchospora pubera]
MMVQDRVVPKTVPTPPHHTPSRSNNRNFAKRLDFATWASENSYKILAVFLVIGAVAALFFLRNAGDSAALLCFEQSNSAKSAAHKIHYPQISWSNVAPVRPLGPSVPYSSFKSEKWILVSVSSAPTDALRALTRIKGWQLLAVGNSETPTDWSVKGAIYLSLEQQAQLGFRSVDFLPYSSYVRKSVGYLFAIQHGAKMIFDADDRAEVLGSDLGRHFNTDLVEQKHPVLLQYSHANPNRTVVNPYIHFGQRSVWPRGLPLDHVGDVAHEEFYTEVFGGRQFIQQGLSNGLPDVDAVFYYTRKSSGLESFDIRFDEDAPKVVLPQGMMVPVNSFNTLYHSQAFWGLMLPVSVSSMASDVIRGYWAQRILWEIGGYVAVYPPTIYRMDKVEAYPFSEEKDLHVNVNRLIKFLNSWRSNKRTLFERILHLSYAMAEEGFWSEQDVKMTAAWLQDLLAIGYQQPRLMSLELDRGRAAIGHGDKKEFVPKKLPSVHLGVEETGTVNFEIGNLIRWRKHFGNVVLVMHLGAPVDRTALEWRLLYGRIFKTVIILAEQGSWDLAVEQCPLGHAYKYLPKVFERYSGAEGFLFLQDNMILNYWNLLQADRTKLWITDKVKDSWFTKPKLGNADEWFLKQGEMVAQVVSNFPVHFQTSYKESMGDEDKITFCSSELFYIPGRFVGDFADLVGLVGDLDIHHKIAVPMFFLSMDSPQNFDSDALAKTVYKTKLSPNDTFSSIYTAQAPAVFPMKVQNEVDFVKLVRLMASGDPLLMELV